tara:strand:+ start:1874 stop:2305 length:432 start_codon:yes stop_codon:yes gene_type:complete
MKVGDTIQSKRYPQNGLFKVYETHEDHSHGYDFKIVYHPVGNPNKLATSDAKYYRVVEEATESAEQVAANEVQVATEAIKAFVKARPALIIKPNSPTAAALRPLEENLFWKLYRLYTLTKVPNATSEARYTARIVTDAICIKG